MQAGVLTAPHTLALEPRPIPEPGRDEIRIRLKLVGVCGSDVSLFLGHRPNLRLPLVIGHEGLGFVDKLGEGVTTHQLGHRVVIEPNYPCGQCEFCWQGRGNICPNKRIIGVQETGCFAEYVVVPAAFAWPIPASISDEDVVVIEPTAVALHTLYSSPARPGDAIAIIGLGAIGLLLTHLAQRMGYTVLAYDRVPEKVALAAELGAQPVSAQTNAQELAQLWQAARVHTVFECAGAAPALTMAVEAAPRGAYVVVTGLADKPSVITEFVIARQGIQLIPSLIYDHPVDFRRTISLIESGFLQPGKIISSQSPFADLPQALVRASAGREAKIVLNF